MSVKKRQRKGKDGKVHEFWMVDVKFRHPDGREAPRVRRVAPTRREGEEMERQIRHALLFGTYEEEQTPTLAEFWKEYEQTYVDAKLKPATVKTVKAIGRQLKTHFGAMKLSKIETLEIDRYVAKLARDGRAPKTVSNHLGVLLGVLSKAKEWKKLREIPKINWPKIPEPEFDFLTFEEAPRLIAGADVEWAPMIALAIHTGLRRGELRALRWEDVDLVAGKLLVRQAVSVGENGPVIGTPKSGKKREIPLNAIAQEALKAQRRQGIRGELVFPHPDGRLLSEGELRIGLERACRKAGLRQIGWHALRHTFASHLVMRRVPLRSVQELLGHSKVDITMRYAHLSPEVGREAVKALEGEVSPAATGGADYAKVLEKLRNRS